MKTWRSVAVGIHFAVLLALPICEARTTMRPFVAPIDRASLEAVARDGSRREKLNAIAAVMEHGPAELVLSLDELFGTLVQDQQVASRYCVALAKAERPLAVGSEVDQAFLEATLTRPCRGGTSAAVQAWALRELADLGRPHLLPLRERTLADSPALARQREKLGDELRVRTEFAARGLPGLADGLRHPSPPVARWAVGRLEAEGGAEATAIPRTFVDEIGRDFAAQATAPGVRDATIDAYMRRWASAYQDAAGAVRRLSNPGPEWEGSLIHDLYLR
jgi:hypothetical protein